MNDAGPFERPDVDAADRVGQLVRLAGRRPMPEAAHMARARAAAHGEWRKTVRRRAWRTSLWGLAAAVLALGVVGSLVWPRSRPAAPTVGVEIGVVEVVKGTVTVSSAQDGLRPATRGVRLRTGDRIETGADGRAALSIAGASVRLDRDTAGDVGAGVFALARGAVYVDTGAGPAEAGSLRVTTPLGDVRHVGTQFEVRLGGDELRVSVREGEVVIDRLNGRWASTAGERLIFGAQGSIERQALSPLASDWAWLQDVPMPFRLEGATVPRFLDWASRELGMRWEYRRPEIRGRVARVALHGSVEGLTPDEALEAVLPTAGLSVARTGDRLVVSDAR